MKRLSTTMLLAVGVLLLVPAVSDGSDKSDDPDAPTFLHRPLVSAAPGERLHVTGEPSSPQLLERLVLRYRPLGGADWRESRFRRTSAGGARAAIPADAVEAPGFEYFVVLLPPADAAPSEERSLFASAAAPQPVLVDGLSPASRYARRKAAHDGRLSRIELGYGYNDFGVNLARTDAPAGETLPLGPDDDPDAAARTSAGNRYHAITLGYTYRFLSYLYAIKVEIGGLSYRFEDFKPFNKEPDAEAGMYYIAPSADFEFFKYFGATALLKVGISEAGFEGGGGLSLRIGRLAGTRMDFGFEGMSNAGWLYFLTFTWDTVPYVPMSITLERTQWYAAEHHAVQAWGNRMYFSAAVDLPAGFWLSAHVGYAARDESVQGGLIAGGGVALDF